MSVTGSAITIDRCNSLAHGEEIKTLFRRNGHPNFAGVFDRAYPYAYSIGGASWVARDADGGIVGHVAVFPRVFREGSCRARAALLVDCLFDRSHRNVLSAMQLCRRVVADLRASGAFDFAYSDPTPPAVPIVKAAGFVEFGALQRYVMPAHPLYVRLLELWARDEPLVIEQVTDLSEPGIVNALGRLEGGGFRAERSPELYATRLGGPALPRCSWLVLRSRPDRAGGEVALVLVAHPSRGPVLNVVDVLWDDRRRPLASVFVAVARAAWSQGHTKLGLVTLTPSRFADSLKRCGFFRRPDALPLLGLRLANSALPSRDSWLLTFFDGSGW